MLTFKLTKAIFIGICDTFSWISCCHGQWADLQEQYFTIRDSQIKFRQSVRDYFSAVLTLEICEYDKKYYVHGKEGFSYSEPLRV